MGAPPRLISLGVARLTRKCYLLSQISYRGWRRRVKGNHLKESVT
jgi:hypothetical protein